MAGEYEAPVEGLHVAELQEWVSLWADLLHVDMVLHAREDVPEKAKNIFIRRGLWESAVISYGRTASSGRRKGQVEELLAFLGQDAKDFHAEVMAWRNRHVAHRVDGSREWTDARAVIDLAESKIKAVRVRVSPVLGPEEEDSDLAVRFKQFVGALRDLAWTQRIQPAEKLAIEEHSGNLDLLIETGVGPVENGEKRFSIDVDPSGEAG